MKQNLIEIAILVLVGLGIVAAENLYICISSFALAAVLVAVYVSKEDKK